MYFSNVYEVASDFSSSRKCLSLQDLFTVKQTVTIEYFTLSAPIH
jgi:hypothetical protein